MGPIAIAIAPEDNRAVAEEIIVIVAAVEGLKRTDVWTDIWRQFIYDTKDVECEQVFVHIIFFCCNN